MDYENSFFKIEIIHDNPLVENIFKNVY